MCQGEGVGSIVQQSSDLRVCIFVSDIEAVSCGHGYVQGLKQPSENFNRRKWLNLSSAYNFREDFGDISSVGFHRQILDQWFVQQSSVSEVGLRRSIHGFCTLQGKEPYS